MDEMRVTITKAVNGYEVSARNPDIVRKNRKDDAGWQDPEVDYVFSTYDQMSKFLDDNLDVLLTPPEDEFSGAFQKAVKL